MHIIAHFNELQLLEFANSPVDVISSGMSKDEANTVVFIWLVRWMEPTTAISSAGNKATQRQREEPRCSSFQQASLRSRCQIVLPDGHLVCFPLPLILESAVANASLMISPRFYVAMGHSSRSLGLSERDVKRLMRPLEGRRKPSADLD